MDKVVKKLLDILNKQGKVFQAGTSRGQQFSPWSPELRREISRVLKYEGRVDSLPELRANPEFRVAVARFDLDALDRLIADAVARRNRESEERIQIRKEGKVASALQQLVDEAQKLGCDSDEIASAQDVPALRSLVQQARIRAELKTRARVLGCEDFVNFQLYQGEFEEVRAYLVKSENLFEKAKREGLEGPARRLLAQGKLQGVEKALEAKQRKAERARWEDHMRKRVARIAPISRKDGEALFAQALEAFRNPREFKKIDRELSQFLHRVGV